MAKGHVTASWQKVIGWSKTPVYTEGEKSNDEKNKVKPKKNNTVLNISETQCHRNTVTFHSVFFFFLPIIKCLILNAAGFLYPNTLFYSCSLTLFLIQTVPYHQFYQKWTANNRMAEKKVQQEILLQFYTNKKKILCFKIIAISLD